MSRRLTIGAINSNAKLLESVNKLKGRKQLDELIEKEPSILTIVTKNNSTIIDYVLGNTVFTADDIKHLLDTGAIIKRADILFKLNYEKEHTLKELERIKGIVNLLLENGVNPNEISNNVTFLHKLLYAYFGHNIYQPDYLQKMEIYVDIIIDILKHGGDLSTKGKYKEDTYSYSKVKDISIYDLLLDSTLYSEIINILITRSDAGEYLNIVIKQYPEFINKIFVKLCEIISHNINRKKRDDKQEIFNKTVNTYISYIDILLNNGGNIIADSSIINAFSNIQSNTLQELLNKLNIRIVVGEEEQDNRVIRFTKEGVANVIKTYNGELLNILLESVNINDYKNEIIDGYKKDTEYNRFNTLIEKANITFGTEPSNRVFDVNSVEDDGFDIMIYAINKNDVLFIEKLINGGSDLKDGWVLIDIFNILKDDYEGILSIITKTNALDKVDINYKKESSTLLSIIIRSINIDYFDLQYKNIYNIIKILLEKGIDVNILCYYNNEIQNGLPYNYLFLFYNNIYYNQQNVNIVYKYGIYILNIVELLLNHNLNINSNENISLFGEIINILIKSFDNIDNYSIVISIIKYLIKTDNSNDNKQDILSELYNYKSTIESYKNDEHNDILFVFNIKIIDNIIYLIEHGAILNSDDYIILFNQLFVLFLYIQNEDILPILDTFLSKLVEMNINIDILLYNILNKYIDISNNIKYYQADYDEILRDIEHINDESLKNNAQIQLNDIASSIENNKLNLQQILNIINILKEKGAKYNNDIEELPEELLEILGINDINVADISEQISNNAIPQHNVAMNITATNIAADAENTLSNVPYKVNDRTLKALSTKFFKGITQEYLDKYNPVIEQFVHPTSLQPPFSKEKLVSFCPVCLSIEDHENETCMYMSHDCKLNSTTGYYNKDLYEKCSNIKIWPDERVPHHISWCALCGRACGNHVHTMLSKYGEEIVGYNLETDGIEGQAFDSNCIKSGGGDYPEKLKRYIAFRDKAYTLNKLIEAGNQIKFTDAMDQISAAAWNGPSTVSDERVQKLIKHIRQFKIVEAKYEKGRKSALNTLIHNAIAANNSGKSQENIKKDVIDNFTYKERPLSSNIVWNISSKRFPEKQIIEVDNLLIPDVPNSTPELMPIVHERIDEDNNIVNVFGIAFDLSDINDYFIIQFNHNQQDGTINNHSDSMVSRVGLKNTIRTFINDHDHRLGFCPIPGCTAFMHPDELKVALGVDKTEDEFIEQIFKIASEISMNQDEAREYAAREYDDNKDIYYEYKMVFNKKIYDFVINGMPHKGGFSKTKKQRGFLKRKATRGKKLKKKVAA
jgi:hypothetical protein